MIAAFTHLGLSALSYMPYGRCTADSCYALAAPRYHSAGLFCPLPVCQWFGQKETYGPQRCASVVSALSELSTG